MSSPSVYHPNALFRWAYPKETNGSQPGGITEEPFRYASKSDWSIDIVAPWSARIESISSVLDDGLRRFLSTMPGKIAVPVAWQSEGIAEPNSTARDLTNEFVTRIFLKHDVLPAEVSASVEEGIALIFRRKKGKRELFVEVFNNGEIGAVVLHGRKVIVHKALNGIQDNSFDDLLSYI